MTLHTLAAHVVEQLYVGSRLRPHGNHRHGELFLGWLFARDAGHHGGAAHCVHICARDRQCVMVDRR
jgi:hypothetical protein